MPKPMYVWTGTAWVSVASEVESLATYATQSYADNTPGTRMIIPSSVVVGSGSGSVSTQGTINFSGASSVSINGCFTSSYDDYLIKYNSTLSNSANLRIRMRSAGTDATGTNYTTQYLYGTSTTVATAVTTEDKGYLSVVDASGRNVTDFIIYNPNLAVNTFVNSKFTNSAMATGMCGINHGVATAYDSVTIYPGAGTMTGTINIYGLKKG